MDIIAAREEARTGPEFVFGLEDTFGNDMTDNVRDGRILAPRQHRGVSVVFDSPEPDYNSPAADDRGHGRMRNGQSAPLEATTHPLLLDASATGNRGSSGKSSGSRRPQR